MTEHKHDHGLRYLVAAFGVYIVFVTLENIYFGASFFGVAPPSYLSWMANISTWQFLILDTLGVALLAIIVVLGILQSRKHRSREVEGRHRRMRESNRGSGAIGAVVALVLLLVLFWWLNSNGITLQVLWNGARGFLGLH